MATQVTEAEVWRRVVAPEDGDMDAGLAEYMLGLDFTAADHERMAELSRKANQRTLDTDERQELESYVTVGHVLAMLQAKARRSLRRRPSAA